MTAPATLEVNPRDRGLVRGIGPLGLAANMVNYTVGASIFVMPALTAKAAGAWAPAAFLIAAIANAALTICYAEATSRVPTSGGQAGFTEVAFGRFPAFLTGIFTYLANVLAAGAILAATADTAAAFVPALANPPVRAALIIGWVSLLFAFNLRGVAVATRLVGLAATLKLVPLAIFLVVGVFFVDSANLPLPALPATGLGDAALLAVFLFAGVHGAMLTGGEIRNPARTLPRALVLGLVAITTVFVGAQLVAQGILGPALAGSATPLADALGRVSPGLRALMLAGALLSMLGWTASDALNTPRLVFAMARDGRLPAALGVIDPRHAVPARAIGVHLVIAAALAVGGSFALLATVSTLVLVLLFIGAALAALQLRRRGVAMGGAVSALPGLPLAVPLVIGIMLWVTAQATGAQLAALAGLVAVLALWFWVSEKIRP
ncbi:MAG: APC family permease [Polymorphobacter sp.]